jgi:hypothetical protein
MEIITHFLSKTHIITISDKDVNPTGMFIKLELFRLAKVPIDLIYLVCDGLLLRDNDVISESSSMIVRASLRVVGGKGGFGAMLRSLAKQAGKKKTTDFGACRDLSGRRLRHVNDEIILQKWQEAKDNDQEWDVEQETKTGIDMWFLGAPSWADGFKGDQRKKFMRPRRKTRMCIDWVRAREEGTPPMNAPASWGCPRGERCDFAHGEDDLQDGDEKQQILAQKKNEAVNAEKVKRDQYMAGIDGRETEEEAGHNAMLLAIQKGLHARKRSKQDAVRSDSKEESVSNEPNRPLVSSNEMHSVDKTDESTRDISASQTASSSSKEVTSSLWLTEVHPRPPANASISQSGKVECVAGEFCTVMVNGCNIGSSGGSWYYEVQLVTAGLLQVNTFLHSTVCIMCS